MEMKLNIADPKNGKTIKKELKDEEMKPLLGKKINDIVKGEFLNFPNYEFKITGGSDFCGFPMRHDVDGQMRKKILIVKGVGVRNKVKGLRLRKTVAGNMVYVNTAQVNLSVVKYGETPLPIQEKTEKKEEK